MLPGLHCHASIYVSKNFIGEVLESEFKVFWLILTVRMEIQFAYQVVGTPVHLDLEPLCISKA